MDNGGAAAASPYVSPTLQPQAAHINAAAAFQASAAAAAAAAGGALGSPGMTQFQEALMSRMGRPFGLTSADMKDSPFAASLGLAAAGRTTAEGFAAAAGLPLLSHMGQLPFPHHFMDPRAVSFSSAAAAAGAFRPFLTTSSATPTTSDAVSVMSKSFPSAFQPPSGGDRSKGSPPGQQQLFSPGQNLFPRSGSAGSPRSSSTSPPTSLSSQSHRNKTDENSNSNVHLDRHGESVSPSSMDSNHHHDGGALMSALESDRHNAAKRLRVSSATELGGTHPCPICLMPLRPNEMEGHYMQELEVMTKMQGAFMAQQQQLKQQQLQQQQGFKSPSGPMRDAAGSPFHKALSPRGNPLEVAPRSRWDTFQRIQRNRQSRIRVKLSRRAGKRPDEILEEEEEMSPVNKHMQMQLQQGHHALQLQQQRLKAQQQQLAQQQLEQQKQQQQHEEDIDIVGDSKENLNNANNTSHNSDGSGASARELQLKAFGPPQFSDSDVVACMSLVEKEKESSSEGGIKREPEEAMEGSEAEEESEEEKSLKRKSKGDEEEEEDLAALKAKVKALELDHRCAKCSKKMSSPVVNVGCWHIQCERCWLTSLGTNKNCSQCGLTTTPNDLRRVFL